MNEYAPIHPISERGGGCHAFGPLQSCPLHKILRVTPAMPTGVRLGAAVRAGSEQLRCTGGGRVWGCAFGVGGMLASGLVRRVAAAGDGDRQELLFSVRTM